MNLASWLILAAVAVWILAAVKIAFFGGFRKEKKHGGCCDVGDIEEEFRITSACAGCNKSDCSACAGSATSRNALTPTIRDLS